MIDINEALAILLDDVTVTSKQEQLELLDAHRRVLAETQLASIDVPPADVSAMDGYAIRLADLSKHTTLPVTQRIAAGHPAKPLQSGSAARLFTGSEIPANADTVVIQEDTKTDGDKVEFLSLPKPGANVRPRGQDIKAGSDLLFAGHPLQAQDLGLLASVGIKAAPCFCPLKIGVLSTGDELVEPGEPTAPGKIYNSNRYTLKGLINSLQMTFVNLGHVKDELNSTIDALKSASQQVDVILSTGGVSVGEEDHIKDAVAALGKLNLWKLAIKPGKPLAYGKINNSQGASTPFFGLPGNPVAVFVTFLMVVRPYLLKMQGQNEEAPKPLRLSSEFSIDKPSPRQEYRRVRLNGNSVHEYHSQDSGVLSSTHWANALAVVPANTKIAVGDSVDVYPFSYFNL